MDDRYPRITSLQNDQVKNLVRLRNRRERDRQQVTLLEEPLVIRRAMAAQYPMSCLYYCPSLLVPEDQSLLAELQAMAATRSDFLITEMTEPVMAKVSYRDSAAGLLVVVPQRSISLADLKFPPSAAPLLIVLESVEKPGNLGAILRIADGAGAHAVIVCGQGTDLFNPNVMRASRGTCFAVPTVVCTRDEMLAFLVDGGIGIVATSPAAAGTWDHTDLTGPTAILLGTEHAGLSDDLLNRADMVVKVPMRGRGDSLNVATAAAILLYEAVRQRSAGV